MMQFIKVTCFPFGSLFFFFFLSWSDKVVLNPSPSPELLSSVVTTLTCLWLVSLPAEEGLLHLLLSPVLLWANQGRNLKTHIWQWFSSGIVQELPIWVGNDLCSSILKITKKVMLLAASHSGITFTCFLVTNQSTQSTAITTKYFRNHYCVVSSVLSCPSDTETSGCTFNLPVSGNRRKINKWKDFCYSSTYFALKMKQIKHQISVSAFPAPLLGSICTSSSWVLHWTRHWGAQHPPSAIQSCQQSLYIWMGNSIWKSILQKCQQQVRGYQHTSGGKLAETSFLVLWWKLEIWTSLRKEEIFFPWWNLVGEIHFLRPVCNRAVSWSHWPKF